MCDQFGSGEESLVTILGVASLEGSGGGGQS